MKQNLQANNMWSSNRDHEQTFGSVDNTGGRLPLYAFIGGSMRRDDLAREELRRRELHMEELGREEFQREEMRRKEIMKEKMMWLMKERTREAHGDHQNPQAKHSHDRPLSKWDVRRYGGGRDFTAPLTENGDNHNSQVPLSPYMPEWDVCRYGGGRDLYLFRSAFQKKQGDQPCDVISANDYQNRLDANIDYDYGYAYSLDPVLSGRDLCSHGGILDHAHQHHHHHHRHRPQSANVADTLCRHGMALVVALVFLILKHLMNIQVYTVCAHILASFKNYRQINTCPMLLLVSLITKLGLISLLIIRGWIVITIEGDLVVLQLTLLYRTGIHYAPQTYGLLFMELLAAHRHCTSRLKSIKC